MRVSHDMRRRSAKKWMGKNICNKEPEKRQQYTNAKRNEEVYDLDDTDDQEQDDEDMYFELEIEQTALSHASASKRLNISDFMTISIISLIVYCCCSTYNCWGERWLEMRHLKFYRDYRIGYTIEQLRVFV